MENFFQKLVYGNERAKQLRKNSAPAPSTPPAPTPQKSSPPAPQQNIRHSVSQNNNTTPPQHSTPPRSLTTTTSKEQQQQQDNSGEIVISGPMNVRYTSHQKCPFETLSPKADSFVISSPKAVNHEVHVHQDSNGLAGLPPEWLVRLSSSGLTSEQMSKEPQAVLAALKASFRKVVSPHMAPSVFVLKRETTDPKLQYTNMVCLATGLQFDGQLFRAICNTTCVDVAIKKYSVGLEDDRFEALRNEIEIISKLECTSLVKFVRYHWFQDEVWIVMEYMEYGAIATYLDEDEETPFKPFDEFAISYIMKQVFTGLSYLHRTRRMHRDIKSDNICVGSEGEIKLADFGVSCCIDDVQEGSNTVVGTTLWMAPEVIRGELYDCSADVWSAGIFMLELIHGVPPYIDEDPLAAMFHIITDDPPKLRGPSYSPEMQHFLAMLLVKEHTQRVNSWNVFGHPFLLKSNSYDPRTLVKELQQRRVKN
eukprot:PhF_6_TR30155/c0_g1_i3/m.44168